MLTAYAIFATVALAVLLVSGFSTSQTRRFEEIDVERINIVEPDGGRTMVIANSKRLPEAERRTSNPSGTAGILFFNGEGVELGGLTFNGAIHDGERYANGHLSFDQFQQDQVLVLSYGESPDQGRAAGLRVLDRTDEFSLDERVEKQEAARQGDEEAQRWLKENAGYGKSWSNRIVMASVDHQAVVSVNDTKARPRIRMTVDSSDVARLEFLDTEGKVVYRLPDDALQRERT